MRRTVRSSSDSLTADEATVTSWTSHGRTDSRSMRNLHTGSVYGMSLVLTA